MMKYMDSRRFVPVDSQGSSVMELNRFRNEFTHYTVKSWVIYPSVIATFPRIIDDIASVIEFLAFDSKNINWYHTDGKIEEITKYAIDSFHRAAEEISQFYYETACPIIGKGNARDFLLPRVKNDKNKKTNMHDT